jgi:hypothetical protein
MVNLIMEKAPSSKLQTPEKHQNSSSKHGVRELSSVELGVSLELGAWSLELWDDPSH